jgi:hypothetical protein
VRPVTPPPVPPPADDERRNTMVGYIDDAIIQTNFRIRFESAQHDPLPDRAEFFYAKCGCYAGLQGTGLAHLFDPQAPGPRPNIANDINYQQLYLRGEYAASRHVSGFIELPFRWLKPQGFLLDGEGFPNSSGIGDVRGGVKVALLSTPKHVVTAKLQAYLPTGDASVGLGTNHASLEPSLLYFTQATDKVRVESQFGVWHPYVGSVGFDPSQPERFAGNIVFYGFGPSVDLYHGRGFSLAPVVEFLGWHVTSGFQTKDPGNPPVNDASGTNIFNIKIGARLSWTDKGSIYVGWGHALTDERWYSSVLRIEYRYGLKK